MQARVKEFLKRNPCLLDPLSDSEEEESEGQELDEERVEEIDIIT